MIFFNLNDLIRLAEKRKPEWENFIENLGYTPEQGEKFVEGYILTMKGLILIAQERVLM